MASTRNNTAFAVAISAASAFTPGCASVTNSQRFGGFRVVPKRGARLSHAAQQWLMKIGIVYGTITGNTEEIAGFIKAELGDEADDAFDISDMTPESLAAYDGLFVGAPTWNTGEDEKRSSTDWDDFLYDELPEADLTGKPVAVFGIGDGVGYGDNFCDALGELHDCFKKQGAKMVGYTPSDSVEYVASKSVRGDVFLGLAVDMTNDPESAEGRVAKWVAQVKTEM